ncbi:MAG: hypothetical protein SV062_09890 [Thermodesulfobacteriota bacterium]|nr:hypothetical protein [Thermodesulfobacteriota bacterium]
MTKHFFAADIHLTPKEPEKEDLFLNFLDFVKIERGDLYILGDCFDYWANNRRVVSENRSILEKFLDITKAHVNVKMFSGNRDFLIKPEILEPWGIEFFGEDAVIDIEGKTLYLTHGYNLCERDYKFQNYKRRVWPLFRLLDTILPGRFAAFLAELFILKSKSVISSQDERNLIFSIDLVRSYLSQGMDFVICGHFHKSLIKEILPEKYFIVLPAWEKRIGGYFLIEDKSFKMMEFK